MAMSTSLPAAWRSSANCSAAYCDRRRRFDVARRALLRRSGLERGEALGHARFQRVHAVAVRVDADAVARRSAEQFVNRHAQRLALDVPQRLIDAAERAGQDRAAAIERVAVDGLPVMHHAARIFADQVRLDLLDGFGAGERAAFGDGLAQADDAGVGVDLQKQPARLHQKGFEPGDLEIVFRRDGCGVGLCSGCGAIESREPGAGKHAPNEGTAIDRLHKIRLILYRGPCPGASSPSARRCRRE